MLTGTNSHAGGTTVSDGVLQIGDGGTSGSITGAIVNNRTLAFDHSDDIAFAGVISGTGDIQKRGAGSLSLTGVNTYSGGTLIARGTLIGSARSFGVSQIMNNGALVVDQAVDVSFGNTINGTGSFTKRGAGNLTLSGRSALFGATTVEAGKLSVNGSLASSAITVLDGGTLGGSGTVGGIVAKAGATVAPGNSIGTLTVSGRGRLRAGARLQPPPAPYRGCARGHPSRHREAPTPLRGALRAARSTELLRKADPSAFAWAIVRSRPAPPR